MFSAVFNSQNKLNSIPIDSVTWSISGPTNSTYSNSDQAVFVDSISPVGATYTTTYTYAKNAGEVASTTITGTGIYTGSFTSPNLTIIPATLTLTSTQTYPPPIGPSNCYGYSVARFDFVIGGLFGSDSVQFVALNGPTWEPIYITPVGTNPAIDGNCVSNLLGDAVNPKTITGATSVGYGFYMAVNDGGNFYWFSVNNSSYVTKNNNYTTPATVGYAENTCGT